MNPARSIPQPGTVLEARQRPDTIRRISYSLSAFACVFGLALVAVLVGDSLPLWRHSGLAFYTGSEWFFRAERFGILPMVYGTVVASAIALFVAGPIALGAAVFTSEFLPPRRRLAVKAFVELLAGVPSIVYGLLGLLILRPWVYRQLEPFDPISGDSLLTAGLLLAVMILPTIMTLSDDALASVPVGQRRAARGLGLTSSETVWRVALPGAWPGITAAALLGLGRALGETIAVFLVVGRQDNQWLGGDGSGSLWRSWIEPGQTMTTKLGGSETFLAHGDPLHWAAICALALTALLLVSAIHLVGAGLVAARSVARRAPHAS